MSVRAVVLGAWFCLVSHQVLAGDAVAMGYNWDGVWTAVTYIRSLTPKGGQHYHEAAQAGVFAVQDLRRRANTDLWRTKVIGQSDRTGYVTVAHGTSSKPNTGITVIGRGKTQSEADKDALRQLAHAAATENEKIIYQYFSYGADSVAAHAKRRVSHAG